MVVRELSTEGICWLVNEVMSASRTLTVDHIVTTLKEAIIASTECETALKVEAVALWLYLAYETELQTAALPSCDLMSIYHNCLKHLPQWLKGVGHGPLCKTLQFELAGIGARDETA